MQKSSSQILVIGFAIFAMFFGAGNLIFPPYLGFHAGAGFMPAMIGFLLTGVGLPLLGIISTTKAGGCMEALLGKVHPWFEKVMGLFIILAIGPFYAIPRTAATTHELGVLPMLPVWPLWATSALYFLIVYFFVARPSKVIDYIGKVLTPVLLALLAFIILKAILDPIGAPLPGLAGTGLTEGFTEGYQTMDAVVSMIFTGVVISSLVCQGITERKVQVKMTILASLLAAVLLALVYGGLTYLGATGSALYPQDMERTQLLSALVENVMGPFGKAALGLTVSFACLTTAIGVTTASSEYFYDRLKEKVPYSKIVQTVLVASFLLSVLGVDSLIRIAAPVLEVIYPPVIVVILLNLLSPVFQRRAIYIAGTGGAFLVSFTQALKKLGVPGSAVASGAFDLLPLSAHGFAWLSMATLCVIAALLLTFKKPREAAAQ